MGAGEQVGSVSGLWIPAKGSQPGEVKVSQISPGQVTERRSVLALHVHLCSQSLPLPESNEGHDGDTRFGLQPLT